MRKLGIGSHLLYNTHQLIIYFCEHVRAGNPVAIIRIPSGHNVKPVFHNLLFSRNAKTRFDHAKPRFVGNIFILGCPCHIKSPDFGNVKIIFAAVRLYHIQRSSRNQPPSAVLICMSVNDAAAVQSSLRNRQKIVISHVVIDLLSHIITRCSPKPVFQPRSMNVSFSS